MSRIIGTDTEQMAGLVTQLRRVSTETTDQTTSIQAALARLAGAGWSGRHRERTEAGWALVEESLKRTTVDFDNLARRLEALLTAMCAALAQFGETTGVDGLLRFFPGKVPLRLMARFLHLEALKCDSRPAQDLARRPAESGFD